MHENCSGNAAPSDGGVLACHVITDNHVIDFDALHRRLLDCNLEIHHIAGVIFDDAKHAVRICNGFDCFKDCARRRRSENRTGNSRIEHSEADITGMRGLVSGAAAAHQRDFIRLEVFADHDVVIAELDEF